MKILTLILIFILIKVKGNQLQNKTQNLSPFHFNIHSQEQSQIVIPSSTFSQYRSVFNYLKIDGQNYLSNNCQFKHHNIRIENYVLQKINNQVDGNLISFFTFHKYIVAITDKFRIIQFAIDVQEPNNISQDNVSNNTTDQYTLQTVNNRITRIFENVIPLISQEGLQGEIPLFGYSNLKTIHLFFKRRSFYMKISSFNIYEIEDNIYQKRDNIYRVLSLSSNEILIASGKNGIDYYKINSLDDKYEKLQFENKNYQIGTNCDLRDIIFLSKNSTNSIFAVVDFTKTIFVIDANFEVLFQIKDVPPQVTRIASSSPTILLAIGKDNQDDSNLREYIINLNTKSYQLNRSYKGDDESWNEVFADKYMSFVLGKFRSRIFFHGINRVFLPEDEEDNRNMNIMIDLNIYKNIILAFQMPIKEDLLIFAITPDEILSLEISQLPNYLDCYSELEGEGQFELQMLSTECDSTSEILQGYQMCTNSLKVTFDVTKVYIDSKNLTQLIILIILSILFLIIVIALTVWFIIKNYKKKYQVLIEENQNIAQKYQELENQSQYITKSQQQE